MSSRAEWVAPIRKRWLQRDGALVPICHTPIVITDEASNMHMNPDALSYLCYEQSISINTAATGGDIELLSM